MEKKTTKDLRFLRFLLDVLVDVVIVVVLVLFIRTYLFAPFRVHGPSMCDTFNNYDGQCFNGDGEFILVSKLPTWNLFGWSPSTLDRGDVIVFQAPYSVAGEFYIKRVIGMPGDTLKIENGYVYLKDATGTFVQLDEPYLNADNLGHTYPYRATSETYTVPDGEYFALGDNRTMSSDARRCFQELGCTNDASPYLKLSLVQGEVKFVLFPFSHMKFISDQDYGL